MFFITSKILCFTFLSILGQIQSLVEQPAVEDNSIAATERVIRNTVNNLFTSLNQSLEYQKSKFKQFSIVHNFFVSITLQDHDNLNEIARLTKVDKADNSIEIFMTQLNEVLNEDNKSDEATDVVYVTSLIGTFLERLEGLKETYGLNRNVSIFEINKDVVKHLSIDQNVFQNETKSINGTKDIILGNNEFLESGRRIYQGKRVKISRFPFMASVQFFRKFQCGGSIIKSDLVITSASCLQLAWNNRFFRENPAFLSVQVGCDFYEGGEENIPVQEIYFHPNYNPKNLRHNLALMRLRRLLKFGKKVRKVKKIDIDRNPWPLPSNTDGITVIGWGARSTSNIIQNPWSNRLSFAVLEFYPLEECQEVYSKEYVTDRHFCAGFFSKGGGACNRDAGGPGVAHGLLLGVVSFGSPVCGAPDAPTVFTKLGYYTDWIEEIMEQEVPQAFHSTTEKSSVRTVILPFSELFEETTLRIKPIDDTIEVIKPPSIKVADSLRTLDKDKFFKEFISTMFDSHQLEEYLDVTVAKDDNDETTDTAETTTTSIVDTIKPKHKFKIKSKPNNETSKLETTTKFTPHTTTPSADTSESSESPTSEEATRVTRMDEIDLKVKTNPKLHKNKSHKKTRVNDNSSEDKKLENVIVSLIDDIDVEHFLHSKSEEMIRYSSQENFGRHKHHPKSKDDEQGKMADIQQTEAPAPKFNESSLKDLAKAMNIDESILTFLYYANKKDNNHTNLTNKQKESYQELFLNIDNKDTKSDNEQKERFREDDEAKYKERSDDSDDDGDSDDDHGDEGDDDDDDDDDSGGYEALSIPIPEFRSSPPNSNETLGVMDIMLSNPDDVYNLISEVVKKKANQKIAP